MPPSPAGSAAAAARAQRHPPLMTPLRRALVTLDLPLEARAVFDAAYRVDHAPELVFGSTGAVARVAGKVLGIVGMGRIGRAVARRARAFGMAIHYANRSRLDPQREDGAIHHADPEDLPHIGSSTIETRVAMARRLVDGLQQFTQGSDAPNRIA